MAQHLVHTATVKALQALPELLAHKVSRVPFLAGLQLVVLTDVVMLQPAESRRRIIQASCGHAPCANRGAHQVHVMV